MMHRPVAILRAGDTIVTQRGVVDFVRANRHSVTVVTPHGVEEEIPRSELVCQPVVDGKVAHSVRALEPWWSSLPEKARRQALFWLAVVCEVLYGYRGGHDRYAEAGEPLDIFADPKATLSEKCERMAQLLRVEAEYDRERVRRFYDGEIKHLSVTQRTVENYVRRFQESGLEGLVDQRLTRPISFANLDPRLIELIDEALSIFNGDVSSASAKEVRRRVLLLRKDRGLTDVLVPQRMTAELISERLRHLGSTPRAHAGVQMRAHSAGYASNYHLHPAHLSLDMTRVDVMVLDPATGKVHSCEVILVISVSTRVCVALRVVPKSARAFEAGLALYDACRDMSAELAVTVDDVTMDDFRSTYPWSVDVSQVGLRRSKNVIIPAGQTLAGVVLHKPGVRPVSVRLDNGSIFTGREFPALLDSLGIHLMPSNVRSPGDNSITERLNETIQAACMELLEAGYKARNPVQRGRKVGADPDKLLTVEELERHLWRWIALSYHRVQHEGLHLPGDPHTPVSPLAMWDALMEVTGAVAVPFHPDLIMSFLPVLELTIQHDGVEHQNRTYDSEVLNEFRQIRKGQFIPDSYCVPFHEDPRCPDRLFFRHPETDRIHSIWWRQRQSLEVPMTAWVVERARKTLRDQGGPAAIRSEAVMVQIINEIGSISRIKSPDHAKRAAYAARLRWEQAQRDHAEAEQAQADHDRANGILAFPDHHGDTDEAPADVDCPKVPNTPKSRKQIPGRDWFNF